MKSSSGTLYQVYVLENETGKYYIGYSVNVDQRLEQHNRGESKWTAKFRPWRIVWRSEVLSRKEAFALEKLLKKQGRGDGFFRKTGLQRPGS